MDFLENEEGNMRNPFEDNASKYETFLYKHSMQMLGWLAALTKSVEELEKRVNTHERAHNAASAQAMRMSEPVVKEDKPN